MRAVITTRSDHVLKAEIPNEGALTPVCVVGDHRGSAGNEPISLNLSNKVPFQIPNISLFSYYATNVQRQVERLR